MDVPPSHAEAGEVVAEPVGVVGRGAALPRDAEKLATSLRQRRRLAAHAEHEVELRPVEQVQLSWRPRLACTNDGYLSSRI